MRFTPPSGIVPATLGYGSTSAPFHSSQAHVMTPERHENDTRLNLQSSGPLSCMSSLVVPMMPSRAIAHGIPRAPEKSALLVFLTEDASNQNNILDQVRPWLDDCKIQPWRPSNHTLRFLAAQGRHRDSMANLYGLAIVCHRTGWSHFLVADELTNRQVSGNLRCSESANVSLVMISVHPRREGDRLGDVRVLAKRTTDPGDRGDLYRRLQTFEISSSFIGNDAYQEVDIYNHAGLQLHDPHRTLFAPDSARSLARETLLHDLHQVLSVQKGLPAELTNEIVGQLDAHEAGDYAIPPGLSTGRTDWNMFLLRPTTEQERAILQSSLNKILILPSRQAAEDDPGLDTRPCAQIHIVPWQEDRPASRRDISRLNQAWQRVAGQFVLEQWMLGLPSPGDEGVVKLLKLEVDDGRLAHLYKKPMEVSIPGVFGTGDQTCGTPARLAALPSDVFEDEILYDPAAPFCPYPPPFLPIDPKMNSVAVFCLTHLSLEERKRIQDTICAEADGDNPEHPAKVCCIVPWEKQEADGSLDDMWDIFWRITRLEAMHEGRVYQYHYMPPYFFVDRQSLVDKTIIAVDKYEYSPRAGDHRGVDVLKGVANPHIRGFLYGRIAPEEAHLVRDNRTSGNMFFEELLDAPEDVKKYPRPDWPGHGILVDEWSEDEDEDEQE